MLSADGFTEALNSSYLMAYGLALLGGLMDCLTPCSAIATPVALSYFSTINPAIERRHMGRLIVAFAVALSLTYMLMGLLAAWIGGIVYAWVGQSPWPYLVVGMLLLYLVAASAELLPAWMLPSFLRKTTIPDFGGKRGTIKGAAAVGVGVALMMGPCAAPVLTAILILVAQKQDLTFGVSLLFAFSLGISSFMVTVALLGRRGLKELGRIGSIRGFVGKAVNVAVAIIALIVLANGVMKAHRAWTTPMPSAQQMQAAVAIQRCSAIPIEPILLTYGELKAEETLKNGSLTAGVAFPNIPLIDSKNQSKTLKEYMAGRWLFVTFWGTWCKECVAEIPSVLAMAKDPAMKDRLTILALSVNDSPETVKAFAVEHCMTYPLVLDPESELVDHLGVFSYPYNVLVNPDGKVVYAHGSFPTQYQKYIDGALPAR